MPEIDIGLRECRVETSVHQVPCYILSTPGRALNHAKTYSQTCKNGTRRGFGDDGHWSDGQEAEVTYTLASVTKLEAHVRPTRGLDRDCFGDALILGGTVAASLIAAPETLGASLAAGAVVAGSEWNALNSCFGK